VGLPALRDGAYRPWFINKTKADLSLLMEKPSLFGPDLEVRDAGAQFGGHVVSYENNLHFATVHGAGHMVRDWICSIKERKEKKRIKMECREEV
jgi:cathepsin A (carboxypeptidase C)